MVSWVQIKILVFGSGTKKCQSCSFFGSSHLKRENFSARWPQLHKNQAIFGRPNFHVHYFGAKSFSGETEKHENRICDSKTFCLYKWYWQFSFVIGLLFSFRPIKQENCFRTLFSFFFSSSYSDLKY
jgi:hypothetical protein